MEHENLNITKNFNILQIWEILLILFQYIVINFSSLHL